MRARPPKEQRLVPPGEDENDVELTDFSQNDDDVDDESAANSAADLPPTLRGSYVRRLLDVCGWRFLAFLAISQGGSKGMLMAVVNSSMLPLFRNQVDAATLQLYTMIAMLPWSLKPLIGLCSDYVLIAGYRKRGWLVLGLAAGLGSTVTLVVMPGAWSAAVLVGCFTGVQFQIALYDLLAEAKYSELRNAQPAIGSDITTLVQGMHDVGMLAALLFVGFLADAGAYRVLFAIALGLSAAPLLPTLLGWLSEERMMPAKLVQLSPDSSRSDLPLVLLMAFCGLSSVAVAALEGWPLIGLCLSFALLVGCLVGAHWVFGGGLLVQVALFQVLTTVAQPSMGSALSYYYTANATCVPGGPQFGYAYYISYTGIVGMALSLAGVVIYQFALSRLRFRPVLLITTILVGLAGLSDLSMVLRLNVALGIPDHVAYMLGEAIVEPLLTKLSWIPVSALISMASEPGREACSFAFMAGLSNFARMQARLSGAVLTSAAGLGLADPHTGLCDFSALWWMVLFCHVLFPLIIGVAAVWIIPNLDQRQANE